MVELARNPHEMVEGFVARVLHGIGYGGMSHQILEGVYIMARIAKKSVSADGVLFNFADGKNLSLGIDALPEEIQRKLAIHGLSQKVGDSYAGAESIAEAFASAEEVWKNLLAGLWSAKVQRGGKLVEALHRATGKDLETCRGLVEGMDDKAKAELRKHVQIKEALAEMEVERAKALAAAAEGEEEDLKALF